MIPETLSKQPGSAVSALPEAALAGLLNHLLSQHSWAMARLRPHAGKTLQLRLPLTSVALTIQEDGRFAPAVPGARFDATLTPNLLAWLTSPDTAARFIAGGEDAVLAKELAETLGKMRWDAEEDLSRVLGDIAAHKLVSTATDILEWHRNAAETLARSWAEHWQEEKPVLAQPDQVHAFFNEVGELHDRVERLEQKIKQLSAK
ncbi:MAG: ubiquinone biosynthesis accessory factor UbiJ [Sulfuricella sp.]